MSKIMRVPESCKDCRYSPFGNLCTGQSCKECEMGDNSLCKCLSMQKGSICPHARYDKEDTCVICGEKYSFAETISGIKLGSYRIALFASDDTALEEGRLFKTAPVCPTCGEQLKKCMEENLNDL